MALKLHNSIRRDPYTKQLCYDMSMFSVVANFLVMFTLYDRSLAVPLFAILCKNISVVRQFGTTIFLVHPFLTLCAKLSHNPSDIFPKVYQSFERKKVLFKNLKGRLKPL